jgi:hypothetical protein
MREVRIWDIALDASKLQSRMGRTLIGTEPHMLGYWRMDEADISTIKNHVPRHQYTANVQRVLSRETELALDKSAFPYLLDQINLQWPYSGHWSARGEEEITTAPALDRSGIICFGAGNTLYGVQASDGARVWGEETPDGTSAPVAADRFFHIDVRAGLDSGDGDQWMPVVGGADDDDLRLFPFQELAVILVGFGLVAGFLLNPFECGMEEGVIDVAHRDDLAFAGGHGLAEDVHSPPTGADDGGAVFAGGGIGAEQWEG